ncbi:cysteine desulfurase [Sulfurifustis variabilis]|uniref:cysteine desulfurase n=1 Tax=Sulfurifustis variabilis TaxID=1675686 RepID=A0A1B4V6V5_9GAMM|nr:cysteine desulfurase family protein [Sulfurifustis variabilis]BAU49279.1 cysteine desulfurase [Sulfurifustis variabilis]
MSLPVYLDYNATTPVAPEVLEAMEPFLRGQFGNPSSAHAYGAQAADAVAKARRQVAGLIGAHEREMVFTGCATEANNLAIAGAAWARSEKGRHLITSTIEHPSVAAPFRRLQAQGWEVTVLPVDAYGRVDPANLAAALRPDTVLVSVMHANNEVGTIQPVAEMARLARRHGALFHTDAAQSVGKIVVNVDELAVDLLTLAGHKFYAPKGVGALYVRTGTPLTPVLVGAGQEHRLRPGTENVPCIVGLGSAAESARRMLPELSRQLRRVRDTLHDGLLEAVAGLALNGHPVERLPNTLNVSFPDVSGRDLLAHVEAVAASVGSACHEDEDTVSGVLAAMGISLLRARGAIRLSTGRFTTVEQAREACNSLVAAWRSLARAAHP